MFHDPYKRSHIGLTYEHRAIKHCMRVQFVQELAGSIDLRLAHVPNVSFTSAL